jgi:hypothetical protein
LVIDRAIVSTDNNPLYYEFWPLVAKGWKNLKIEPTLALIGDVKLNYSCGTIVTLPTIPDISSGFIAQVIRFIIPCLFPDEISIIADIDMLPLSRNYFSTNINRYADDDILVFSADAYKTEVRYPMCYIVAKGKYFQEIIGLKNTDLASIQSFIKDLYALNLNWDTDELFFAKKLHESALFNKVIFLKRGGWNPYARKRIDRSSWQYSRVNLFFDKYIDAHCLRPLHDHMQQLSSLIEYIDHDTDGKKYFNYLLKKPVKNLIAHFKLLKQNLLGKDLYDILEVKSLDTTKKNIISFSLFGDTQRYTDHLGSVIDSYNQLLPDWKCRVYVAKDVQKKHIDLLIDKGCEIVIMNGIGVDCTYTIWRFLAIGDKKADAVIIRDLDSHASEREKRMLDEWLSSEKQFHIIRDHVNHNSRILAGTWGAKKNNIDIIKKSKNMLLENYYGVDQVFLESLIYPLIKNNMMVHDIFLRFNDEKPIIIPLSPKENYIGEISTDINLKNRDKEDAIKSAQKYFELQ